MKKGKVVILPMILVAVFAIAALVFGLFFLKEQPEKKSIFNFHTVGQVLDAGNKRAIDDSFKFTGIEEFGYTGDGQIDVVDDKIDSIWFITNLSTEVCEADVKGLVTKFVEDFCEIKQLKVIENPIKLQYCDEENFKNRPEDDYVALSEGYILFEYSYRDKDGVLWIVQVFSPQEDYLSGLIVKQINEEDFEGYEPQIDMRKEMVDHE